MARAADVQRSEVGLMKYTFGNSKIANEVTGSLVPRPSGKRLGKGAGKRAS